MTQKEDVLPIFKYLVINKYLNKYSKENSSSKRKLVFQKPLKMLQRRKTRKSKYWKELKTTKLIKNNTTVEVRGAKWCSDVLHC